MFNASCSAIFGTGFPSKEILDDYGKFENSISPFMKRYPRLLNREGYRARDSVKKHMEEYFDSPAVNLASHMVKAHLEVS